MHIISEEKNSKLNDKITALKIILTLKKVKIYNICAIMFFFFCILGQKIRFMCNFIYLRSISLSKGGGGEH